ncbi:MAG: glycoside hydrolase family 5 protein [Mediterranea sp.]|jgi:endoglucanase|nr:glycoside hydrolase family 5 protein [Mediterranea sp.]
MRRRIFEKKRSTLPALIGFLLMALVALPVCSGNPAEAGEEEETNAAAVPRLVVKGTQLMNDRGEPVQLRGVSYGWHNFWPRFYNASCVEWLVKDWHTQVVRAAMGVEPKGAYLSNPQQGLNCVQAVVDAAIKNHIYAIIDWHSHGIRTEEAKTFFCQMATRYRGVPNVIYEIFNEPVEDSWDAVKAYSMEVVNVIRSIDPEALILVGSPHWDQDVHIAADAPLAHVHNIMYTLHFYANTHRQELRDRADYALRKGLPLFVSECASMEATGDGPIDSVEWGKWLTWMNEHGISWVTWSVSDKDETCSMLLPTASSEGHWRESDLKEWGKMVRSELSIGIR